MSLPLSGHGSRTRSPGTSGAWRWGKAESTAGPVAGGRGPEIQATLRWLDSRDGMQNSPRWRGVRRRLVNHLNRLNAPFVYPWSPSCQGAGRAHELHRAAADLLRRQAQGPFARLVFWGKVVTWPVLAAAMIVPALLCCGAHVRRRFGLPLRDQVRDLWDALWRHGIFPSEYYHHRVFASPARADKSLYLNESEMAALLREAGRGGDGARIDRLPQFLAGCRAAGLPSPRSVARFENGSIEFSSEFGASGVLPDRDLFWRPLQWRAGDTGQVWRWNPQARGWSFAGEVLGSSALLKRCRLQAGARPHLLQEAVHNHPEMARFTVGGLCTVRIATGLGAHAEPLPLFATLRVPSVESGGRPGPVLVAGIDLVRGSLSTAWGELMVDGEFETHPGTGALIAGAGVPQWQAIVDLALRAHARFGGVPFVGWEIAVGGAGPILIDASTNWGVFPHVLPAETAFAQLCLARLGELRRANLGAHPLTQPVGAGAVVRAPGGVPAPGIVRS